MVPTLIENFIEIPVVIGKPEQAVAAFQNVQDLAACSCPSPKVKRVPGLARLARGRPGPPRSSSCAMSQEQELHVRAGILLHTVTGEQAAHGNR